ncbi:MAG: ribose 5-phosphate isomerase B [Thermodesulfobacteriota bacterium]
MNIWIASDHAGFPMKQDIIDYLGRKYPEWTVDDMGPEDESPVDYPVYAHRVGAGVSCGDCRRGILICGTGLGMSMMANRFLGVRAALCTTVEMAELSRQHNDANILCLSGRKVSLQDNMAIIDTWLGTEFTDEPRHLRRIDLMDILQSR